MRKFMSIVAVLAILFALAVPTFASGSPAADLPQIQEQPDNLDAGQQLVTQEVPAGEVAAAEKGALDAAKEKVENLPADAEVTDVFDIHVEENGKEVEGYSKTTVVVLTGLGDDVVAIMYEHNGEWISAPFTPKGNGTYEVTFDGFCTVVVLSKASSIEPAPKPEGDKKPSGESGKTSPQTGFDASAYMTAAMVLVLFAGFCFVKARKVTE